MKLSKKTELPKDAMSQDAGCKNDADMPAHARRLIVVTETEHQNLRISSYRYLLP